MPAMMLPHGCEGLRVWRRTVWWTFRRPFMGRPVSRQFLRNALLDVTTIVPATAYHRRSYTRDTVGLLATKEVTSRHTVGLYIPPMISYTLAQILLERTSMDTNHAASS